MSEHSEHSHAEHSHSEHISAKTHFKVFIALIVLTIITVLAPFVEMGWMNTPVAFLVATIKGSLVLLFFMHLIDDEKTNIVIILSSFFFLFLFVFFTSLDIFTRIPQPVTL